MPRASGSAGALARLEEALGAPAPAAFAALPGERLEHLADALTQARRRQAHELGQAGERGLRFVPRLLRGPLRKVLG